MYKKLLIDISRNIGHNTAVWPGEMHITYDTLSSIKNGSSCNVHLMHMGLHTGTHIEAPLHFIDDGTSIDQMDLNAFIGEAKVFEIVSKKSISLADIASLDICKGDIVLFKTQNSEIKDEDDFVDSYIYLEYEAAVFLTKKGIKSVGIDYLSIENFHTKIFKTHKVLLSNGIGIIEGLNLTDVRKGKYFLSCLPLKIKGVEASPARAVLMPI